MPNIGEIKDLELLEKMKYAAQCHWKRLQKENGEETDAKMGEIFVELTKVNMRIGELISEKAAK